MTDAWTRASDDAFYEACNKANIFLGLIENKLNSVLDGLHLVDYISVHIRLDLERHQPIIVFLHHVQSRCQMYVGLSRHFDAYSTDSNIMI